MSKEKKTTKVQEKAIETKALSASDYAKTLADLKHKINEAQLRAAMVR